MYSEDTSTRACCFLSMQVREKLVERYGMPIEEILEFLANREVAEEYIRITNRCRECGHEVYCYVPKYTRPKIIFGLQSVDAICKTCNEHSNWRRVSGGDRYVLSERL